MPTGSCMCGRIRYVYDGEPASTALCHGDDNRKISNLAYFQIRRDWFTLVTGRPKIWTKQSESGQDISNHFCDNCGTVLFRTGSPPYITGYVDIRAGTLDDQTLLEKYVPDVELFSEKRPAWMKPINGAVQLTGHNYSNGEGGKVLV